MRRSIDRWVNKHFCYPPPQPPPGADPAGAAQRDFSACVRARESLVLRRVRAGADEELCRRRSLTKCCAIYSRRPARNMCDRMYTPYTHDMIIIVYDRLVGPTVCSVTKIDICGVRSVGSPTNAKRRAWVVDSLFFCSFSCAPAGSSAVLTPLLYLPTHLFPATVTITTAVVVVVMAAARPSTSKTSKKNKT